MPTVKLNFDKMNIGIIQKLYISCALVSNVDVDSVDAYVLYISYRKTLIRIELYKIIDGFPVRH